MLIVHDINDRTVLLTQAVKLFRLIRSCFPVHTANVLGHRDKCIFSVLQIKGFKTYADSQHEQQSRYDRKGSKEKARFFTQ